MNLFIAVSGTKMNQDDRNKLRSNTVFLKQDLHIDTMFLAVLKQRGTLNDTTIKDIKVRKYWDLFMS